MNYQALKDRITAVYGTQAAFAKRLGVSEQTVSRKLNGKTLLKVSDVIKWSFLLKLSAAETNRFFFESNA